MADVSGPASNLEELADAIRAGSDVVALTGAGMSAPSGVPTFRGQDGIWDRFDEGQFRYGRFRSDPAGFWRDRVELERAMYGAQIEPNPAHTGLARLGAAGVLDAIITQNTDGLHERAATQVADETNATDSGESVGAELLELHGTALYAACPSCGHRIERTEALARVDGGDCPPRCDCGSAYKPDVVLFGEALPAGSLQRAQSLASESDVFLAVGSSLQVEPAASLPRLANANGATVAVVNLDPTPLDDTARFVLHEGVTDVLPQLAALLGADD